MDDCNHIYSKCILNYSYIIVVITKRNKHKVNSNNYSTLGFCLPKATPMILLNSQYLK